METASLEIVAGICTKNCESTIRHVLLSVDKGLSRFYPYRKCGIIVCDLSTDSTEDVVKKTKTNNPVFFLQQKGKPGKGNAVKTIFKHALEMNASTILLIDGDLLSVKPSWVRSLTEPVINGFDLTVPYYDRHKYDSVITNHVVYPFVASVYGKEIRQPIGGEFGLSSRFVKDLLEHPRFPEGFGIDIFITTCALAWNMKVVETRLGVKNHASTRSYKNFCDTLLPMFDQVVSTLFEITVHHENRIKNMKGVEKIQRFGDIEHSSLEELDIDWKFLYKKFLESYERLAKSDIFSEKTKSAFEEVVSKGDVISVDLWSSALFEGFRYYRKTRDIATVLEALKPVWMGRVSSFIRETQLMSNVDAECMIKGQVDIFLERRSMIFQDT